MYDITKPKETINQSVSPCDKIGATNIEAKQTWPISLKISAVALNLAELKIMLIKYQ